MAISEAGKNCKANTLKRLNKQLNEIKTKNTNSYLSSLDADFPYTIVSACTTAEHERGGIVFLLHNKWRHRIVGKPIIDHNGRWICIDVRTPRGRTFLDCSLPTYQPTKQCTCQTGMGRTPGICNLPPPQTQPHSIPIW